MSPLPPPTPGQMTEEEPAAKKAKVAKKPENKPAVQEAHVSRSVDVPVAQPYPSNADAAAAAPESQLYQDAAVLAAPLAPPAAPAAAAPAVSSVSITRRDPRMARHTSSSVTVTYSAPEKTTNSSSNSAEALAAPVSTPLTDLAPKLPLPMPPAPPPPPPPSVPKPAKTRCAIILFFSPLRVYFLKMIFLIVLNILHLCPFTEK